MPIPFAAAAAAAAAVGTIALTPLAVPAALGAFGWGSAGVAAGSVAAGIQAGMGGNIVAGSLFAIAQSIGAGGAIPTLVYAATGAAGAAVGAGAAAGLAGGAAAAAGAAAPVAGAAGVAAGAASAGGATGVGASAISAALGVIASGLFAIARSIGAIRERCYICGNKEHNGNNCTETTNGFMTRVWRGPNDEVVCFEFNKWDGCQREKHWSAHLQSLR